MLHNVMGVCVGRPSVERVNNFNCQHQFKNFGFLWPSSLPTTDWTCSRNRFFVAWSDCESSVICCWVFGCRGNWWRRLFCGPRCGSCLIHVPNTLKLRGGERKFMFCSLSHRVVARLPNSQLCFYSSSVFDDWVVSEGHGRVVSPCPRDGHPLLWEEGCSWPLLSRERPSPTLWLSFVAVAVVTVSYIVQGLLYPLKCSETPSGL